MEECHCKVSVEKSIVKVRLQAGNVGVHDAAHGSYGAHWAKVEVGPICQVRAGAEHGKGVLDDPGSEQGGQKENHRSTDLLFDF